jgi:Protein of unknown function (DUF2924)
MGRMTDRFGIDAQIVETEIARLRDLDPAALRLHWREVAGREPGSGLKGELLRTALAHKLQEAAFGPLSRDAARRLDALAREHRQQSATGAPALPLRRIKPGSRLIRSWQGVTHEVVVLPDGFLWNGARHPSLSSIARAITGVSWNGWRFFGLADGRPSTIRTSLERSPKDRREATTAETAHAPVS